jgi:hypothetical protein
VNVRVIRVGAIPFGLSVLVDEQPGSLVVWLLDSDWSEDLARHIEQILATPWRPRENSVAVPQPDLHTV